MSTGETHWGPSPFHPGDTEHRGRREDCSGPDCGPEIPEGWGVWCPHGAHIVVPDPGLTDEDGYPVGRIAEPWPCDRCTRDGYEAAMEQEWLDSQPSWEEIHGLY